MSGWIVLAVAIVVLGLGGGLTIALHRFRSEPKLIVSGDALELRSVSHSDVVAVFQAFERAVVAKDDGDVTQWLAREGPLFRHSCEVVGLSFSPTGQSLATLGHDDTVRLWNITTGTPIGRPLTGDTGRLVGAAFGPDDRTLAIASTDHPVRIWDIITGRPIRRSVIGRVGPVTDATFSPDGRIMAIFGVDDTVRLWDINTGQPVAPPLTSEAGPVADAAFSADGRSLATITIDRTVQLWDVTDGMPIGPPIRGNASEVRGVAVSPDGRTLATVSGDRTVRLWDPMASTPIGLSLTGHTDVVDGLAFSPDGRMLATASEDHTVRVWDVLDGASIGPPLTGHTGPVRAVAFSPDGRTLATASDDRTVRLWEPMSARETLTALEGSALGGRTSVLEPSDPAIYDRLRRVRTRLAVIQFAEEVSLRSTGSSDGTGSIYLSTGDFDLANEFFAAFVELLGSVGIEVTADGAPILGSWFQRLKLALRRAVSSPGFTDGVEKGLYAAETMGLRGPMSEVNVNQAEAIARLAAAADCVDQFLAITDGVVLVKATAADGRTEIVTRTLTVSQIRDFERRPELATDPAAMLRYLREPHEPDVRAALPELSDE